MNISVKYKEQRGGCEAEVWLTVDVDTIAIDDIRAWLDVFKFQTKASVGAMLSDCTCSPSKKDCCP